MREDEDDDWVVENKFEPVRTEIKNGQDIIEITKATRPGALTGIDKVYYQKLYPVAAVVYGLYPLRDPDLENLAPLRDGKLNHVTQRVVQHFEGSMTGQGLTHSRSEKVRNGKRGSRDGCYI